ncbi:MAG: type II toxin-antitoxin system RelE/ParE family toxin [Gammaproteobacteria bacterium]|nr:type II toxin-antitoxin system RelE/ParE family toxin [Gammaproteobacteria bacterium]
MTRIELAPGVVEDFARILEHLVANAAEAPANRMREIIAALDILALNPLIGRPTDNDLRELIIGRGAHGYLALYRFLDDIDTVFVIGVSSQREAGYAESEGR